MDDDDILRTQITDALDKGLKTQTEPIPQNNFQFESILKELRKIDRALPEKEKVLKKLEISGYINTPYGEDDYRCLECMYYLVHRKWCDLPEINLPAEPEWWCRLWRI